MNLYKNKIALLLVIGLSSFINAALPSNISELVENENDFRATLPSHQRPLVELRSRTPSSAA